MEALEAGVDVLSDVLNLPIDLTRYILLLFCCYPVALVFQHVLHPAHTSLTIRHVFSATVGIIMGLICFGWQMLWVIGMAGVSYALLWLCPPTIVQWCTMVWALSSLSVAHFHRYLASHPQNGHIDYTAALMILVQKVTLAAFALHDGLAQKDQSLNSDQRKHKIKMRPSLLEYLSYTFSFNSVLDGPTCTFRDHLQFMDGSNLKRHNVGSAMYPVLSKMVFSLFVLATFNILSFFVHDDDLLNPEFSIFFRLLISYLMCFKTRCFFYVSWLLGDSVSNAAGLGFNGYDKEGSARWDLVSVGRYRDIELPLTPVSVARGWNIPTALWLKRCSYERITFSPVLGTFFLSALWHGFQPGYYLCLLFFGVSIIASKKLRYLVRPFFQSSPELKRVYDVMTFVATQICLIFGAVAFVYQSLDKVLLFWSYFYYLPLIIACTVAFIIPNGKRNDKKITTGVVDNKHQPCLEDVTESNQRDVQSSTVARDKLD